MELELDTTTLTGYELSFSQTMHTEETMETIVPDASPDISDICTTEAVVCLNRKFIESNRISLSGTIKAFILYIPESESPLSKLNVTIPFNVRLDDSRIGDTCFASVHVQVQSADTRIINPRKVMIRIRLISDIQIYSQINTPICSGVSDSSSYSIEEMTSVIPLLVIPSALEKPFTVSEELVLPPGLPDAEELLTYRCCLCCAESKILGNKLIFKGTASLQTLYRACDGAITASSFTLPLSQIIEVNADTDDCFSQIQLIISDVTCSLDPDDSRRFHFDLSASAQAVVRQTRSLTVLRDLYSTEHTLTVDQNQADTLQLLDRGIKSQTVRENLECPGIASHILDTCVCLGSLTREELPGQTSITIPTVITVLYQDDSGACASVTRTFDITSTLDHSAFAECVCSCSIAGDIYSGISTGGIEVRCQLDCSYILIHREPVSLIERVAVDDANQDCAGKKPSVVLQVFDSNESLWDIAKKYQTTTGCILQANNLNEEDSLQSRLLLIPCRH